MQVNDVASAFLKAVRKFQRGKQMGLQELRMLFRDKTKLQEFVDALHLQADRVSNEPERLQATLKRTIQRGNCQHKILQIPTISSITFVKCT